MGRTLIEVEADHDGWAIKLVGSPPERRETKLEAMGAAIDLAAHRHARTGEPTGVSVQVGMGRVLIAMRC